MTTCKLEAVVSTRRGPRAPLKTLSSSKLAAILTKLSRARLTPRLISKLSSRLMFKVVRRRRLISSRKNSIGMKLQLINSGLSTVHSTFVDIQKLDIRVTLKTSSSFPSKDPIMAMSLPELKMCLRRILSNSIRFSVTLMPPSSSLRLKTKWMLTNLSSKKLNRRKKAEKSSLGKDNNKFRGLRSKFKYKRTNKVSLKLIGSMEGSREDRDRVQLLCSKGSSIHRLCKGERIIRLQEARGRKQIGRPTTRDILREPPLIKFNRNQPPLLIISTQILKMIIHFSKVGRSRNLMRMSRDWPLCHPLWDLSTPYQWRRMRTPMTTPSQLRLLPSPVEEWWIRLLSWRTKCLPWVAESSSLRSKRKRMRVNCSFFKQKFIISS